MQNILIYPGALIELENLISQNKEFRPFFVTGNSSFTTSGAKEKIEKIVNLKNPIYFSQFSPNPDIKDVKTGINLFQSSDCNVVISIGGGSVIDMAKLIIYYQNHEINENQIKTNLDCEQVKHICIPTTAGSGSESTHFAVMYVGNTKYSVANNKLLPEHVIIDTDLHHSQTKYQKAVSGADALAQSIESLWSVNSTDLSRKYSENALKTIWNSLPELIEKGSEASHIQMAVGSNLAGKAINIAKTTAPHAFSYGITKHSGLPHGHAVSLFIPYFLNNINKVDNHNCNDSRGSHFVIDIINKMSAIIGCSPDNIADTIKQLYTQIGLSLDLNFLKISQNAIRKTISNVNEERLKNYPVKIDVQHLQEHLLKKIK